MNYIKVKIFNLNGGASIAVRDKFKHLWDLFPEFIEHENDEITDEDKKNQEVLFSLITPDSTKIRRYLFDKLREKYNNFNYFEKYNLLYSNEKEIGFLAEEFFDHFEVLEPGLLKVDDIKNPIIQVDIHKKYPSVILDNEFQLEYLHPELPQFLKESESENKFVLVEMAILGGHKRDGEKSEDHADHANVLVFNLEKKTIEIFEPHGVFNDNDTAVYFKANTLQKEFQDFKVENDTLVQCIKGPQEDDNFCATWSQIYLLLRVANPNYIQSEIVNAIIYNKERNINFYINMNKQILKENEN